MSQITDGNSGKSVKVDDSNRLTTFSIVETATDFASKGGDAYNINTGDIAYTGTSDSSVLYVLNNETRDLVITAIAVGIGALSATVTDSARVTVIRNPTGGDIISSPTNVDMNANTNFGSNNTLAVTALKGDDGGTITGGTDIIQFYMDGNERIYAPIPLRIPKGSSVGIKVDLNTSGGGNMYAAIICHLHDDTQITV